MDKIAYLSPLNPIKSGISDYSEDLIPELSKYYDIDIYIPDNFKPSNDRLTEFGILRKYHELATYYPTYKAVIYHMGNNYYAHGEIFDLLLKFPGTVVLHDFSLHHFFAQKSLENGDSQGYLNEMLYCHGEDGVETANKFFRGESEPPWETQSLYFPMNLRVLDCASSVIVHSRFTKNKIEELAPYVPVFQVPMPSPHIIDPDQSSIIKRKARDLLGLNDDILVISTLGFVNPTKRVDKILLALGQLKKEKRIPKFKFIIAGQISEDYSINNFIHKMGLQDDVICTGFISLEQFENYIAASDFCINLRYPTQGESSASLLRILGYGKPVIVTDIGSFSDFEIDYVVKIPYDENELDQLKISIEQLLSTSLNSSHSILQYIREHHSLHIVANKYKQAIDGLIASRSGNMMIAINKYLSFLVNRTVGIGNPDPLSLYIDNTLASITAILSVLQ